MAALSCRPETNRHLLDDDSHREGENNEGKKETDSELRARRGIRQHTRAVVFTQHNQYARSNEQPEQPHPRQWTAARASVSDTSTVVGAIDIFVGDYDVFLRSRACE
jgi:hypothetical protein